MRWTLFLKCVAVADTMAMPSKNLFMSGPTVLVIAMANKQVITKL